MKTARTVIEGERFLHKELWRIVLRQLDHARNIPAGAFHNDLVTMTFAFHALEAYLNYVGAKLAPDIWENERSFFQKEPYRGFDGMIRKVLELAGISEPDRSVRPYGTVWFLKGFRDLIAHGKTEKVAMTYEHSVEEEALWMRTPLDDLVTVEKAERAHDDILEFAQQIHNAARTKIDDVWFGSGAFDGPLQHSQGSSVIEP